MASVALDERRLKTLSVFGDVNKLVDEAIDDYLTKKIKDRVKTAREKLAEFESKYGASYAAFSEKMALDQAYYDRVNKMNPLWEQDSLQWEYWQEKAQEWTEKLNGFYPAYSGAHTSSAHW